jgi:hypothetical protein
VLQLQMALSNTYEAALPSLHACSQLTTTSFSKWLSARTSGMMLLSSQLPADQQQLYASVLAEQGYDQLARSADGQLFASPAGMQALQDAMDKALLQAKQGISSGTVSITSNLSCDKGDTQSPTDQGTLRLTVGLPTAGGPTQGTGSSGGGGDDQQQHDGSATGSGQQDGDTPSQSKFSTPKGATASDTCVHVLLSQQPWTNNGLPASSRAAVPGHGSTSAAQHISSSSSSSATTPALVVTFKGDLPDSGIALQVGVRMRACIKEEMSS